MLVLAILATAGCQHAGHSARPDSRSSRTASTDAFARGEERKAYVDAHYEQVLKSGRAANADQARAVAGLDWDNHVRNHPEPTESWSWSSDDARRREQDKFEADLEKLK